MVSSLFSGLRRKSRFSTRASKSTLFDDVFQRKGQAVADVEQLKKVLRKSESGSSPELGTEEGRKSKTPEERQMRKSTKAKKTETPAEEETGVAA